MRKGNYNMLDLLKVVGVILFIAFLPQMCKKMNMEIIIIMLVILNIQREKKEI